MQGRRLAKEEWRYGKLACVDVANAFATFESVFEGEAGAGGGGGGVRGRHGCCRQYRGSRRLHGSRSSCSRGPTDEPPPQGWRVPEASQGVSLAHEDGIVSRPRLFGSNVCQLLPMSMRMA